MWNTRKRCKALVIHREVRVRKPVDRLQNHLETVLEMDEPDVRSPHPELTEISLPKLNYLYALQPYWGCKFPFLLHLHIVHHHVSHQVEARVSNALLYFNKSVSDVNGL